MTTATTSPIRCVHFLPSIRLADGGVVRAVLDWCGVLAERHECQVTLLTCDPADVPAKWMTRQRCRGLPHVIVLERPRRLGLLTREAGDRAVEAILPADILHLHAPWLTSNLQLATAAGRCCVPYVLSVHGMLDDWSMAQRSVKKRAYLALAGNRLLRRAASVHFTAEGERMQAARWLPRGARTVVLPLLFDAGPYRALPGPEPARQALEAVRRATPDRGKLLFLGRLHEKKGVDLLIESVAELKRRGRECVLWIAGTGEAEYETTLRRLAESLGIADRVEFLGLVSGTEKVSLYQAADLFVLPTSQENFGLVLIEAMAAGTPVITTRGVDIWPELQRAGAAIVERSPAVLAGAIEPLLGDSAARRSLGERGRQWVFEHLDPNRVAGEYEQLYRTVARERADQRTPSSLSTGATFGSGERNTHAGRR